MEYFVNFPSSQFSRPEAWAKNMEAAGWHGVCASDHFWIGASQYPHVFVTATRLACATRRVRITTSFCNNLFRSPVEFSQACLALQQASDGRFEAGLGAGWNEEEMIKTGQDYPRPGVRISKYVEALTITRALLTTGGCTFKGEHYEIDMPQGTLGPKATKPIPPHRFSGWTASHRRN